MQISVLPGRKPRDPTPKETHPVLYSWVWLPGNPRQKCKSQWAEDPFVHLIQTRKMADEEYNRSASPEQTYERRSVSPRRDDDEAGAPVEHTHDDRELDDRDHSMRDRDDLDRRDDRDDENRDHRDDLDRRDDRDDLDRRDDRRDFDRDDRDLDRRSKEPLNDDDDVDAQNEGTNLFVTGVSRYVNETELEDLFKPFGEVLKCQIMMDPHSGESRGFGFVMMADVTGADEALAKLNGHELAGKTLAIEKAKRKRARTPTPGRYFGPPKARRGGRGGGRYGDDRYSRDRYDYRRPPPSRYDDRRYEEDYYRRPPPPRYDDRDRFPGSGAPGGGAGYRGERGGYGGGRYDDRDRERYPPSRDYRGPPPRDSRDMREPRDSYRDRSERGGDRYSRPPPREREFRGEYGAGDDYRS
ncbi:hypothetical protein LXG23DRAFT_50919 [Yarrowia lipolytica]|nr:hypothetical protein LXG23DRAFT_50919 [Yarrowia lipolytica]